MILFLIDDDLEDHEIFQEAVLRINPEYTCITARDGQEALTYLEDKAMVLPDYIFLDLNMPRMDGRKTLQELKRNENFRDIPVCIYTTSSWKSDFQVTKEMGASAYLVKPASVQILSDSLRSVIK